MNFLALAASFSSVVMGTLEAAVLAAVGARLGTTAAAGTEGAAAALAACGAAAAAAVAGVAGANPGGGSHCVAPVPALW